ncbi:MAG: AtpZ/AtpI family protein [Candidatus Tenebribacter davisii]|nr:AtpZ/AtpI family protein [Candidatus Tenebribacter davisii]
MMWKRKTKLNSELLRYLSLVSQLGITVISSILIALVVAVFIEKRVQSDGIVILVGVLIGVAAGIFAAYKLLKKILEKDL